MNNRYLKRTVGRPLSECIAELTVKMPKDPIDFMAKWLYRYMDSELYFYEKKHMMASMRKMQLDIRRQREFRQVNIDRMNGEIKAIIVEMKENAVEMRKLLNQVMHRSKQHITIENYFPQLILPQIQVKKAPKKEKARSYGSVATGITGITGITDITTISSPTSSFKSSGQIEMAASSRHSSERDLVLDMQKRVDRLSFLAHQREKADMTGKLGSLLRIQEQRQRVPHIPSVSGRKDQERRQREALQRLASRAQKEKRDPDDHDHRHSLPTVPQDLDMYDDEEYASSPHGQRDYHSKESLREHIYRAKDSQSDFYSDQQRTARPKEHRERKQWRKDLDKLQTDDSPDVRERGRRHRHRDTDREQLDDSAEFRERSHRHRHKGTEKEQTDGPVEYRERRHRRKKSPEGQRDEYRDYGTELEPEVPFPEDMETGMSPRQMRKPSRQRTSRLRQESAVRRPRYDQQKHKYPDAQRRRKKSSGEALREDIEESLSSSSTSSTESILSTHTRGSSGKSTNSRSRRAFIRKHSLGALVNEKDDEVVAIMKDPELLENLKRLRRIMGSASWTVDCNLGLVCNHSILGLLKGRPPFVPPETPEWWERQGYLAEAFYDHEIYTCDNSDVHELLSIIPQNLALSYSDFQGRVSGQSAPGGSIGQMSASQRSVLLKQFTSKAPKAEKKKKK